jgi:hypothetical protein
MTGLGLPRPTRVHWLMVKPLLRAGVIFRFCPAIIVEVSAKLR